MPHPLTLCLVTQISSGDFARYHDFIAKAVQGGVTSVQLRDKLASKSELHHYALMLKKTLTPLNVPLILNDHVDIAHAIDADGVHLGQTDGSPHDARRILGPDKIIGLSIETSEELDIANEFDCLDYVAASAVFNSQTKTNCKTIWGLDGLKTLVEHSRHPVVGIGGITHHNAHAVMHTGTVGIAVVSAIHDAADPALAASKLIHAMTGEKHV